jgi:hypothetical protein
MFGLSVSEQILMWSYRKFWSGEIFVKNYHQSDLEKLRSALIAQYGSPTFENADFRVVRWQWPYQKIHIQLWYDSLDAPSDPNHVKPKTISLLFTRADESH